MVYKLLFIKLLEFAAISVIALGLIVICIALLPFALIISLTEYLPKLWNQDVKS